MNPKTTGPAKMNAHSMSDVLRRPIVTTSWDDGHTCDLKLADLLHKYKAPATFYPVLRSQTQPLVDRKQIRELAETFEIGGHTSTHRNLCNLQKEIVKNELYANKAELEDLIGKPIDMFSYPWGKYDSILRQAVIGAGFIGARTTRRYYSNPGNDPWSMPTTLAAVPFPPLWRFRHTVRTCNFAGMWELLQVGVSSSWMQIAHHYFQKILKEGGVFHIWGHSWEIEKDGLWKDLGDILEAISGRSDVEYVTNGQLVKRCYGSTLLRDI